MFVLTSVKTVSDPRWSQSQSGVYLHAQHTFPRLKFWCFLSSRQSYILLSRLCQFWGPFSCFSAVIVKISDPSGLLSFARNAHEADLLVLYRCVELHTPKTKWSIFFASQSLHSLPVCFCSTKVNNSRREVIQTILALFVFEALCDLFVK